MCITHQLKAFSEIPNVNENFKLQPQWVKLTRSQEGPRDKAEFRLGRFRHFQISKQLVQVLLSYRAGPHVLSQMVSTLVSVGIPWGALTVPGAWAPPLRTVVELALASEFQRLTSVLRASKAEYHSSGAQVKSFTSLSLIPSLFSKMIK